MNERAHHDDSCKQSIHLMMFPFVVPCLTLLDLCRDEDFSNEDSERTRECLRENFVAKET